MNGRSLLAAKAEVVCKILRRKLRAGSSPALGIEIFRHKTVLAPVKNRVNAAENETKTCPLCGRSGAALVTTKHHLVPKSRQGKVVVPICHDCHRQIHALYTEREIEQRLDTIDKLKTDPQIGAFLAWVKKRPVGTRAQVRTSHGKRKR